MKQPILPDFSAVRGKHLLVALSGGADSVALLHMLAGQRSGLDITLSAAHVAHCIRGEAGHADAEFCRALCTRLNIPLYVEIVDVPESAARSGEGLETAARRLRYNALRKIRTAVGAELIALAHHRDDQAETVLMHLLRGCGPGGIAGMKVFTDDLYRPLLGIPKSALLEYLRSRSESFCTDLTNYDAFTPRNSLRLHGLPALEESYPQASAAIARYAETAFRSDA